MMKTLANALAAVSVLVATATAAQDLHAHTVPARRSVTVQAESGEAAVLVTWTSARGPQGSQLLLRAAWGRSGRARDAMRSLAATEALRGLLFLVDGNVAIPKTTEVKVRVDQKQPVRVFAAVLVTISVPAGSSLSVSRKSGAFTQLRWRTRTGPNINVGASSPIKEKTWIRKRTLRIDW